MDTNPAAALNASDTINLLRGWPSPALLPTALIHSAADTVLSCPSIASDGLLYGPEPGSPPLRHSLAVWLSHFYRPTSGPVTAERLCITGGASQNLGSMLAVFSDPEYTRAVWCVAPAYFLAFRIFEDAGFTGKMRAVPEDEEGLDVAYLRKEMAKIEERAAREGNKVPKFKTARPWAKVYKHIIYCVPSFANPSSRTTTLSRRQELVHLARDFDALIVADDVYDLLQWQSETENPLSERKALIDMEHALQPRIVDIDREIGGATSREGADGFGNACSNGSFSKIAGPGIRVGWVEGTEKFVQGVVGTDLYNRHYFVWHDRSGGAPSQLTSTYINVLLETGALQKHVTTVLRPAYASRYATLMKAITTLLLPLGFTLPQPACGVLGGYFVWLHLPSGISASELGARCQGEGKVIIAPGVMFEVPGDSKLAFPRQIRLCFAWEEEGKLAEGVRRVAEMAGKMLHEANTGIKNGDVMGGRGGESGDFEAVK